MVFEQGNVKVVKMGRPSGPDLNRPLSHRLIHNGCPSCIDQAPYALWLKASKRYKTGQLMSGFCTDCLPAFQKAKIAEGRCDHPDVKFYTDEDGFIDGYLPSEIQVFESA
jgi:hypothetical protein